MLEISEFETPTIDPSGSSWLKTTAGAAKAGTPKIKATKYIVKYMMICAIAVKIIGDRQSSIEDAQKNEIRKTSSAMFSKIVIGRLRDSC